MIRPTAHHIGATPTEGPTRNTGDPPAGHRGLTYAVCSKQPAKQNSP
jgi:hypothetical protein